MITALGLGLLAIVVGLVPIPFIRIRAVYLGVASLLAAAASGVLSFRKAPDWFALGAALPLIAASAILLFIALTGI